MPTEAIYCTSLGEELSFDGHPIFISPLLWTALHEIPQKVSHYQTFESRLLSVVTSAKWYLKKALLVQSKTAHFSALLLTPNSERERQELVANFIDQAVSINLAN